MGPKPPVIEEAKRVAAKIIRGEISPNQGCLILSELCEQNGYISELFQFSALSHEQAGHEQFGFDAENTAPLILEACRALIQQGEVRP